jgi:hypothetical protein
MLSDEVLHGARVAFSHGLEIAVLVGAAIAAAMTLLAASGLRSVVGGGGG